MSLRDKDGRWFEDKDQGLPLERLGEVKLTGDIPSQERGRDHSGDTARPEGEAGTEDPVVGEHPLQMTVSIRT